jgi:DNA (cytosine-5)-methyltransferase 1
MLKNTSRTYLSVDLFSGAGGMTEGFKKAGFHCAFACDNDEKAIETFKYNHPEVICLKRDICELSADDILELANVSPGDVDVLCGGPPCQGFSLAGQRLTNDPRNRLFLEFIRIANKLHPHVIVFENVPGILSMQNGAVVKALNAEFKAIGYTCKSKVINAADYGVPQVRLRFFLIGVRGQREITFPPATHGYSCQLEIDFSLGNPPVNSCNQETYVSLKALQPYITAWEALSDLPYIEHGEGAEELIHSNEYANDYQKSRRGYRKPGYVFNHRAVRHSQKIRHRYSLIAEGSDNKSLPDDIRTKKRNVFKLHRDKPCPTVTCNHRTDLIHPLIPRGSTVREAARLQSFDDDYKFFGNLTRKAKWLTQDDQVGNAVPPLLAQAIAYHIKNKLLPNFY